VVSKAGAPLNLARISVYGNSNFSGSFSWLAGNKKAVKNGKDGLKLKENAESIFTPRAGKNKAERLKIRKTENPNSSCPVGVSAKVCVPSRL